MVEAGDLPVHRVEVTTKLLPGLVDVRGEAVRRQLQADLGIEVGSIRSIMGYLVRGRLTSDQLLLALRELFTDPVIETGLVNDTLLEDHDLMGMPELVIQVGYKPGITDNPGNAALDGLRTLLGEDAPDDLAVSTTRTYVFTGVPEDADPFVIAKSLYNRQIERGQMSRADAIEHHDWPQLGWPGSLAADASGGPVGVTVIDLNVSDEELEAISERGVLALTLTEMKAIQAFYREHRGDAMGDRRAVLGLPAEQPTDVELEALAQTWSEHCKHKIFAARIEHTDTIDGTQRTIDSLFQTCIRGPTMEMANSRPWLLSLFHDNSGVIAWTDGWNLCMKVETHNSPSALDPYGGAMTGIVGVNRDILGTGLGARPLANTDVFCFGEPDTDPETMPEGLFHPSRIMRGVHAGVRVGGNESGIPTVNGAMVFDPRYRGKPLVYCGTVGIMPRELVDGRASHTKTPEAGDLAYMVGGRVGADGIHGATFSSLELTDESPQSVVQIGDPITQKKMLDMILQARDEGLIQAITDNGAGGLSSSVGEMAQLTGGCRLQLADVPLKQAGLSPWEILVSESQERMTVAVRPVDAEAFEALAALHEVEATVVAQFTDDGCFRADYGEGCVALLPLDFLHDGVPQLELRSEWVPPQVGAPAWPSVPRAAADRRAFWAGWLEALLARPNIASKEPWVRQYDHEVQAQTVIKPFVGAERDGPADAALIAPLLGERRGAVVSNGLAPHYSDLDAEAMAIAAVDEAVRNAVCVGVDIERMVALDNFCWPDPVESEKTPDGAYKLAQLVRANEGLQRICEAYGLPLISGKDSMKNDVGEGEGRISVLPTLLVSLIGDHPDVTQTTTSDLKVVGDVLMLVGTTRQELGATEVARAVVRAHGGDVGGEVPRADLKANLAAYGAVTRAIRDGLVQSAHDCSEGGLAVAVAESVIGGRLGVRLDVDELVTEGEVDDWGRLFGESLGRLLLSVTPDRLAELQQRLDGVAHAVIGEVTDDGQMVVKQGRTTLFEADVAHLAQVWCTALEFEEVEA